MLNNKKKNAFTITELVIVIAVIAILAAVLIPTFSNVVDKANDTVALQEARNELQNYLIVEPDANDLLITYTDGEDVYYFTFVSGELAKSNLTSTEGYTLTAAEGYTAENTKVAIYEKN